MNRQTTGLLITVLAFFVLVFANSHHFPGFSGLAQAEETKVPQAAMTCPKCQGVFEAGMIRDYWNSNSFEPTYWSPAGEKQHLFSYGKRFKVKVYRCTACGYLEAYANP